MGGIADIMGFLSFVGRRRIDFSNRYEADADIHKPA